MNCFIPSNIKKGKSGWFALKLDSEKAYDRIRWDFLYLALQAFNFHHIWINWIMTCVTSSSFQILVNDSPTSSFPACLRQGDPFSPALFIIFLEFLSLMLDFAVSNKSLIGFKSCRGAPLITHNFYANDSIIFLKATYTNFFNLSSLLDLFCSWYGEKINFQKSSIIFTSNFAPSDARSLARVLNVKIAANPGNIWVLLVCGL